MTIEVLPFEHRPRNSIANNLDKINELVDWVNLDTHLYASASGERVTVDDTSSLKGLTVDGRSVQDGTPTPDAPVEVQVVDGRNIDVKVVYNTKRIRGWAGGDGILHFGNSESMTARVYKGQAITVYGTGDRYFISLFSDEPTTERQKSLWTITPYGTGVQTEPRTYTVEIDHDGWLFAYINAAESDTVRDGSSFFVMREIDLQGNVLASLPAGASVLTSGARDVLRVDSAGHTTADMETGIVVFDGSDDEGWGIATVFGNQPYTTALSNVVLKPPSNGRAVPMLCNRLTATAPSAITTGTIGMALTVTGTLVVRMGSGDADLAAFKADLASNPLVLVYPLATSQTIELGYIDPPAIPSGSVVTVSASLTPTIHLEWWVDDGITALINDLIAYIDYKTEG